MTAERRLAAIMFTDVVGYSALTQRDEALALELLAEHFSLLRPVIAKHKGREIKTIGDSFMVEFASPLEALRCALALQGTLNTRNLVSSKERQIQIRIGIHLGEVEERDGDLFGDGVNIASRIEPLAEPGGVCVTRSVRDQAIGKIESEFESLGTPELKNIATPIEAFKVLLPWSRPHPRLSSQEPESPSDPAPTKSIAVLPLVNLSPDPENEYFSDGITEELIDTLTKVQGLHVVARTSAFAFKGQTQDVRTIGEQLNVGVLLEGSVRKAGDRVRITAQLINVSDGFHLWSQSYNREMEDIFTVQEEIARTIVASLKVQLAAESARKLVEPTTEDLEAYNLYLRARYFLNKRTPEGIQKSVEHFERAIERDPSYALAYAGLAEAHGLFAEYGIVPPKQVFPRAEAAAAKALELDDSLAEAHVSMAMIKGHFEWDGAGAERELQRAIELNPDHVNAHYHFGFDLMVWGRFEEAAVELKRALELDPLSLIVYRNLGNLYYRARHHDEAERWLRKTLELDPGFSATHVVLGMVYITQSRYEEALEQFQEEKALSEGGGLMFVLAEVGTAVTLAQMGQRGEAREVRDRLVAHAQQAYVSPYCLSWLYFSLGEREAGFEQLEKAYETRDPLLRYLKTEPAHDAVRSDPRYVALLKRMGLAS